MKLRDNPIMKVQVGLLPIPPNLPELGFIVKVKDHIMNSQKAGRQHVSDICYESIKTDEMTAVHLNQNAPLLIKRYFMVIFQYDYKALKHPEEFNSIFQQHQRQQS